jgi:hypothetical protein
MVRRTVRGGGGVGSRIVCQARADGLRMKCAENYEIARTPSQSRPRISQTAEALEPWFGGDYMRH